MKKITQSNAICSYCVCYCLLYLLSISCSCFVAVLFICILFSYFTVRFIVSMCVWHCVQ